MNEEPAPRRPRRIRAILAISAAIVLAAAVAVTLVAAGGNATSASSRRSARNFTLPELGQPGRDVSLAAYAGHPVIVNFFASWCGPCKRETPLLASFYRAHHGQVLVIGVDSNDETAAALRFVRADGVTYPVGVDAYPATVTVSYGIVALPQTFLLNARHQIVRHISGALTPGELTAWAATLTGTGKG